MPEQPLLTLRDVNLVYRALPALRGIDWTVEQGQQWACLGPNGAGKTSLARVISHQATHYSGELVKSAPHSVLTFGVSTPSSQSLG